MGCDAEKTGPKTYGKYCATHIAARPCEDVAQDTATKTVSNATRRTRQLRWTSSPRTRITRSKGYKAAKRSREQVKRTCKLRRNQTAALDSPYRTRANAFDSARAQSLERRRRACRSSRIKWRRRRRRMGRVLRPSPSTLSATAYALDTDLTRKLRYLPRRLVPNAR